MLRIIYNNQEHVLSRNRNGILELVNRQTGELLKISSDTVDLKTARLVEPSIAPKAIPFSQRTRSFLTELRNKRAISLKEARKRKIAEKGKDTGEPKVRGRKKTNPALAEAEAALNANLASWPPEMAAKFMEMMKGKKK